MKCPVCHATNVRQSDVCAHCGAPLTRARAERTAERPRRTPGMAVLHALMWARVVLITVVLLGFAIYRIYFWVDAWRMETYYERDGRMAPDVEQVEQESGLMAHVITFYGSDGDSIFIEELRQSYEISGRLTRIEIPDSHWFDVSPEEVEAAILTLTPVLYTEGGDQQPLPVLTLTIDTPESPLKLINPSRQTEQVNTSIYPLSIGVVPKSTVLINGEDQTDMVNFEGILSSNVAVYPVGDNIISILVSTPNHKQTRTDINLYRQYQEINLEPSLNLVKETTSQTITISGTVDPDAILSVDSAHEEGSIKVKADGSFQFVAKLDIVGDNIVTFRASKEGKQDSVVSVTIYYVPSLNAYSRMAWKMDYNALKLYYEIWAGRVFLCDGIVTEVSTEDDEQTVVIDVNRTGEGAPQYVILTNYSSIGTPEVGTRYHAYADVTGIQFYDNDYCPKLACRYLIEKEP